MMFPLAVGCCLMLSLGRTYRVLSACIRARVIQYSSPNLSTGTTLTGIIKPGIWTHVHYNFVNLTLLTHETIVDPPQPVCTSLKMKERKSALTPYIFVLARRCSAP